ncbi:hypothetical protein [Pontibacter pudoricolor]|uniref:hypothetical protein n=1 Tax=Pontibacter pudoricolor TaxID=2694930 RepID=UPI0013919A45|nr:hypothetical protein [Pontibacter pudoricolor]
MKTARVILMGFIFCGATVLLSSCGTRNGEGDDHATQNEHISNGSTDNNMSGDTITLEDTTATM